MISVSDLMLYGIRISQYLEIPHNTLLYNLRKIEEYYE